MPKTSKVSKPKSKDPVKDKPKSKDTLAKVEAPKDLGDCCFTVDTKTITSAVRTLVSSGSYGGGSSDLFGTDGGSVSSVDSLLVQADDDEGLILIYSKLAVYATVKIPAKVFSTGAFVVTAQVLGSLKFPTSTVTLTLKGNKLYFKSGATHGNVQLSGDVQDVIANKPEQIKCDLLLTKQFATDVASKLMYASFDTSLPSYGLPLRIQARKGELTLVSSDCVCAAMLCRKDASVPTMDVTLPGSALIQIVKAIGSDDVKFGASESMFRVTGNGFSVYHPIGVYEVADVKGYLNEEVLKAKHDLDVVVRTISLCDAISTALDINKLAKANNVLDIDFSAGKVTYRNDIAKMSTAFEVVSCKGKEVKHTTDGQKLLAFLAPMKAMKTCRILLYDSRLFMFTEDGALVYIMPIQ